MAPHLVQAAPLLALLLIAAAGDLRTRKIPNWLALLLMLGGLAQAAVAHGLSGIGMSIAGILVAPLIPFVLFAIEAIGAGDVKLMAGVGAWLGPVGGPVVYLLATVLGMLIVLGQAAAQRRLPLLFRNSALVAMNLVHVRQVGLKHASATGRAVRSIGRPLPYAVPVFIAVLVMVMLGRS